MPLGPIVVGASLRVVVDASELPKPEEEEGGREGAAEEEGTAEEGVRTLVDELASFLSEKLGCEVLIEGGELTVEVGDRSLRKRIKQLLKKFLYKQGLRDDYRVISIGEGFKIKRRRFPRLKVSTWPGPAPG